MSGTQNCPLPTGPMQPRAVWLARLCKTRGPAVIGAQAVWEANPLTRKSGPFDRAPQTLHDWGWSPLSGWWEWQVLGTTDALQLTGDFKLIKHNIREQLGAQQITQLIARRPRRFAGMHYHTNRRLICASIASFRSQQEHSLIRTLLARGLWTAVRAHQSQSPAPGGGRGGSSAALSAPSAPSH